MKKVKILFKDNLFNSDFEEIAILRVKDDYKAINYLCEIYEEEQGRNPKGFYYLFDEKLKRLESWAIYKGIRQDFENGVYNYE
jgi:hypothetical protein